MGRFPGIIRGDYSRIWVCMLGWRTQVQALTYVLDDPADCGLKELVHGLTRHPEHPLGGPLYGVHTAPAQGRLHIVASLLPVEVNEGEGQRDVERPRTVRACGAFAGLKGYSQIHPGCWALPFEGGDEVLAEDAAQQLLKGQVHSHRATGAAWGGAGDDGDVSAHYAARGRWRGQAALGTKEPGYSPEAL